MPGIIIIMKTDDKMLHACMNILSPSLTSPLKIHSQIHTPEPLLPEHKIFQVNLKNKKSNR